MFEPRDAPYPELKKTHSMVRKGRPFTDYKPPPAAPVWAAIEGLARYHVLVAALELDIFDTLRDHGPCTLDELALHVAAPAHHLGSLTDAIVAQGLLDQVGGLYDLNDTARRYLVSDGPATMAALVPVAPGPHQNWSQLADTVRNGRPAEPIEDNPSAFYRPLVEGTFTTMYRCAGRADLKLRFSARSTLHILDLGAGAAPWAIAMLEANPAATAVVNDLEGVIDLAEAKANEHGVWDRMAFLPGDFHEVPLERGGYDMVVLGHICRTEGADGAQHLMRRAFEALKPTGQLVLADYFCDNERQRNPHAVLMGATMMASTVRGSCFTYAQYEEWLRGIGFADIRLIEPIGFQQQFVCTKPGGQL